MRPTRNMQAKDIPELPVLRFLANLRWTEAEALGDLSSLIGQPRGATWLQGFDNSIELAMPPYTPPKVALAKMGALIRRGLVEGCACGCRGDFKLTDKGRIAMEAAIADP